MNCPIPAPSPPSSISTIPSESRTACAPTPPSRPNINTMVNPPQSSSATSPLTLGQCSLLSPSIIDSCMANVDQPVQVFLVVYDLLPAGNLSNFAWMFGVGLYHSAVKIPAIGKEITFGGHPHPQISGIFALPVRPDGSPSMPGLRCLCEIDMGYIQTIQQMTPLKSSPSFTRSVNTLHEDDESRGLIQRPPSAALQRDRHKSDSSHQDYSYPPTPTTSANTSPNKPRNSSHHHHHPYASSTTSSIDSTKSSSSLLSSSLTQMETLALILDRLTHSPDWYGTSYDLLRRNCNTFSDQLCMLLTGKNSPSWINRAASLGSAFPCLVPTEWVEPPVAPTQLNQSVDYNEHNYDQQFQFNNSKPSSTSEIKVNNNSSSTTTSCSLSN